VTPEEFKEAIERLGLSQQGAARFLGNNDRTVRRWIAGKARPSACVSMLLRLMLDLGLKPEDVESGDSVLLMRALSRSFKAR
jgi:DNA-binding transcriptional regulator YiaG